MKIIEIIIGLIVVILGLSELFNFLSVLGYLLVPNKFSLKVLKIQDLEDSTIINCNMDNALSCWLSLTFPSGKLTELNDGTIEWKIDAPKTRINFNKRKIDSYSEFSIKSKSKKKLKIILPKSETKFMKIQYGLLLKRHNAEYKIKNIAINFSNKRYRKNKK